MWKRIPSKQFTLIILGEWPWEGKKGRELIFGYTSVWSDLL